MMENTTTFPKGQKAVPGGRRPRPMNADTSEFVAKLGRVLKNRRIAAKITGASLAARLHVSVNTQFSREAGRISFPIEDLYRYALALNCKPSELIKEAEELGKGIEKVDHTPHGE